MTQQDGGSSEHMLESLVRGGLSPILVESVRWLKGSRQQNPCFFFYSFSKVLAENILQEMKNGFSLRQQQLQVIMYYIII